MLVLALLGPSCGLFDSSEEAENSPPAEHFDDPGIGRSGSRSIGRKNDDDPSHEFVNSNQSPVDYDINGDESTRDDH